MEPWSDSWGGCRCPTCEYVAKVANPFFEALQCSVCGRPCEGVTDEKGRLGCSYECAYKIGHVTRDIMLQYAGRKWPAARSNQDAAPYEHARERAEAFRRGADAILPPVSAEDEATVDALLAKAREGVGKRPIGRRPDLDAIRARIGVAHREHPPCASEDVTTLLAYIDDLEAEAATLRHRDALLKRVDDALAEAGCVQPLSFDGTIESAIKDLARRATRAEQLFVDEYDARKAAEREIAELKARITTLEAMKP